MSYLSKLLQRPPVLVQPDADVIPTAAPAEQPDVQPPQEMMPVSMASALRRTPNSVIGQWNRTADHFDSKETPPWKYSWLSGALQGLTSSIYRGKAEAAARENEQMTRSGLSRAGGARNPSLMARALIESGDPELMRAGTRMLTTTSRGGTRYGNASGNAEREFIARENLVQRAARADDNYMDDPEGTLEKWRAHYGQARSSYGSSNAPAAPPAPPRRPPPTGSNPTGGARPDHTQVLNEARDALARGKDPQAVKQRLMQMGVDPSGL